MEDLEVPNHREGTIIGRRIGRREFLKFCGAMAALLGLSKSFIPRIAAAVEKMVESRRPSIIWLEFQSCTGDSEAFTRAASPSVAQALLESISLDYHELLMAAAGGQAEEVRIRSLSENKGEAIVIVEGSIPTKDDGIHCIIGGNSALRILREVEPYALVFIAVGTCAAFGGLPKAFPNPTGAAGVENIIRAKPVINLPGCPANPDVIMGMLVHYLLFERLPDLDSQKRPLFAYGKRIHDLCERRPHFDAGQCVLTFDDYGARQGFCLYKLGCKGPQTYNICASWRWNLNASWPVKAGHPCLGCSERDFWDHHTPFYERLSLVSGFGVEARADTVGGIAVAMAGAGIAAHAISKGVGSLAERRRRARLAREKAAEEEKVEEEAREEEKEEGEPSQNP